MCCREGEIVEEFSAVSSQKVMGLRGRVERLDKVSMVETSVSRMGKEERVAGGEDGRKSGRKSSTSPGWIVPVF